MPYSPYSIMAQLYRYLPKFSNYFNDIKAVAANIVDGSPQTLEINLPAHGLSTGNNVTLSNSQVSNNIIGVHQIVDAVGNSILRFETAVPHDLTMDYTGSITLRGFSDINLNGEFELSLVIDSTHFDIIYDTAPTLTGNEQLIMYIENGIDGVWPITVTDEDNFTVSLLGSMPIQPGAVVALNCSYGFRIYPVYDYKAGIEIYTPQLSANKACLFVIMEDSRASKNPWIESEGREENTNAQQVRTKIINEFSLVAVFPTSSTLTNSAAAELCWNRILMSLYKVMVGINFGQTLNDYITTLIGHGPTEYNHAYYSHAYTFEYIYEITNDDIFLAANIKTRRLNEIDFSFIDPLDAGSKNIVGDHNE